MMKRVLLVAAVLALPMYLFRAAPAGASNIATTNLHVEGMTCGGCATALKLLLKRTPGVIDADVSYEKKSAVVTFDPAATSARTIADAVATALPYAVTVDGVRATAGPTTLVDVAACEAPASVPTKSKTVALPSYRLEELREAFNKASHRVRVVSLLSPTCGHCQNGQRVVEAVFSKYRNDERLRGFVIWLPILPNDDEAAAAAQAGAFVDRRLIQQWDRDRASGRLVAKTLNLKGNAWDVYMLYAPGVKWTGDTPPAPTFWMHQLRAETGADQRACLNPSVFMRKVANLLSGEKGPA